MITVRATPRHGLAAIGAGLCGALINYALPLPVMEASTLLFGGWLSFAVAYRLGPIFGGLAAALTFVPEAWLEGRPWTMVYFGLEALLVGYWVRRKRWSPVTAHAVYWAVLGVPAAFVGSVVLGTTPFPNNWIAFARYPLNSGLLVLMALLVYRAQWFSVALGEPAQSAQNTPLRSILFRRFGVIIGLLIAGISLSLGRVFEQNLFSNARLALRDDALEASRLTALALETHRNALQALAASTREGDPPEVVQERLEHWRKIYPVFLTMLAADADGRIVAAASGDNARVLGMSVADREYFVAAVRTRQSFVSGVFRGRGFGSDLIVAISVPVFAADGRLILVVEGSLDLRKLMFFEPRWNQLQVYGFQLLDATKRVVRSGGVLERPALSSMQEDELPRLAGKANGDEALTYDLTVGDRRERVFVAGATVPNFGWQVIVAQSLWQTERELLLFYAARLGVGLVALVVALALARATAREVTQHFDQVVQSTAALAQGAPIAVAAGPAGFSHEFAAMAKAVHEAALSMRKANEQLASAVQERDVTHAELQRTMDGLEQQVQERTEELEIALRVARTASEAKSAFLARMSHELRTPLNAVLGLSRVMLERSVGQLTEKQTECLRMIEESGDHLLSLINEVLDLAKIESGKMEIFREELRIEAVCEASLRLVRPQAEKKRHTLNAIYRMQSETVFADELRVKQMLVNLLSNAVKFTPEGGRITLDVWESPAEGMLHFAVVDNGVGIPAEALPRLFRKFEQFGQRSTGETGGTGLGLALVRSMAELHGGRVEAASRVGKGSRFTLTLPVRGEAARERPSAPLPEGTRVLIAEDNWANRRLYERGQLFQGCRLAVAVNGLEAMQLATADIPDLILLDVEMPELDGLEVTRRLRKLEAFRTVPIVVVSAYADVEHQRKSAEAGADVFVPKPVDLKKLGIKLADLLHRSRQAPPLS